MMSKHHDQIAEGAEPLLECPPMCDRAPTGFLRQASGADAAQLLAASAQGNGFVMNLSQVWAHLPAADRSIRSLLQLLTEAAGLSERDCAVLVSATASERGDSYCALAWGSKLARHVGAHVSAAVLSGDDQLLDGRGRALAEWARSVVASPASTTAGDVEALRAAGFDDRAVFAVTAFVALRSAFSAVNAALGAQPDHQLQEFAPHPVRDAVSYGRAAATGLARADPL